MSDPPNESAVVQHSLTCLLAGVLFFLVLTIWRIFQQSCVCLSSVDYCVRVFVRLSLS